MNTIANPLSFGEEDLPITLEDASRFGFDFEAWYDSEVVYDDTTPRPNVIETITTAENITLYAGWTFIQDLGNVYGVIIDYNGGIDKNSESSTTAGGGGIVDLKESLNGIAATMELDKAGHVLAGWAYDPDNVSPVLPGTNADKLYKVWAIWE